MKLIVASIPDGHVARVRWLEQHLTGLQLRELVSELAAVHGAPKSITTLVDALAGFRDAVLTNGLAALPPERIQRLLCEPTLLFELQDLVLVEGGAYWQALPSEAEHALAVKNGFAALKAKLEPARSANILRPTFYRRPLFWCSAAAVVLVAVLGIQQLHVKPPIGPQWGFNNAAIYTNDVAHAEYVNRLSKAAGEWFDAAPADNVALAKRIGEFKHGCEKLLVAPHAQLASAERDELLKRCRNWIAQLDKLQTDLSSGRDLGAVRLNTDSIVRKLQDFLKTLA